MQKVPLIFGVTGHRDLREEDIVKLEKSVFNILKEYKTKYPHTEIIVISALAEGADMLVARIAKKLGITLHVLLPYQEEEYLNSFMNRESNEKEFLELKEYASRFEINSCIHTYGAKKCYQQLGEKIANDSNILLALWDGVDIGKSGGTSAIVKYQRDGVKENRFDALDGNAIFIITTPRKSNPNVNTDFSVKKEYLGINVKGKEFEEMLKNVDNLNAQLNNAEFKDNNLLKNYMLFFEDKAQKNQTAFKLLSKIILISTALAFVSLEIMHTMHIDNFTYGYGGFLLLAFAIYYFFMKNGKVQDDFVYSRGFAEAIRVQNAYNGAELNINVAKYYLKEQHHKFTWLKFVLTNLYYIDKEHKPFTPQYDKGNTPDDWIEGQINYFQDALLKRNKSYERLEKIEKFFYIFGFVTLLLMFAILVGEHFNLIPHEKFYVNIGNYNIGEFLEKIGFIQVGEHHHKHLNWHILVLISGVSLLIAAFIGEKYIKIEGYEEEIYHFNIMLNNFKEAKRALERVEKGSNEYKKIIFDLGLKALDENSKWVVLHDKMRAKPSLD